MLRSTDISGIRPTRVFYDHYRGQIFAAINDGSFITFDPISLNRLETNEMNLSDENIFSRDYIFTQSGRMILMIADGDIRLWIRDNGLKEKTSSKDFYPFRQMKLSLSQDESKLLISRNTGVTVVDAQTLEELDHFSFS